MPIVNLPGIGDDPKLEDVIDAFERLRKQLTWLLDKNVDTKNAREFAGWKIRPDKMISADGDVGMSTEDTGSDDIRFFAGPNGDVWFYYVTKSGKLYATDALITGRIEGSVIIGSEIMTSEDTYPMVVLSSSGNIFKASKNTDEFVAVDPDLTGSPSFLFESPNSSGFVSAVESLSRLIFNIVRGDMQINVQDGNLFLLAGIGKHVICDGWDKVFNGSQTLQQALDASTISSGDVTVTDGVATLGNNINTTHLANGSVSNTEFQYLDGVTSPIQTQLNSKKTIVSGSGTTGAETAFGTFFYATLVITYSGFSSAPHVHAVNTNSLACWVSAITPISATSATIYLVSTQSGNVAGKPIIWDAIEN